MHSFILIPCRSHALLQKMTVSRIALAGHVSFATHPNADDASLRTITSQECRNFPVPLNKDAWLESTTGG